MQNKFVNYTFRVSTKLEDSAIKNYLQLDLMHYFSQNRPPPKMSSSTRIELRSHTSLTTVAFPYLFDDIELNPAFLVF